MSTLQQAVLLVTLLTTLAAVLGTEPSDKISCSAFGRSFCPASCTFPQMKEACCRCYEECCSTDDSVQSESTDDGKPEEQADEGPPEEPTQSGPTEVPTDGDSKGESTDQSVLEEPQEERKSDGTDQSISEEQADAGSPEKLILVPKSLTCTEPGYPALVRADGTIWYSLVRPCQLLQCTAGAITVLLDSCASTAATAAPPSATTIPPVDQYLPCEDYDTGRVYAHGETWLGPLPCSTMRCMNGTAHLVSISCSPTLAPPQPPEPTVSPQHDILSTADGACEDQSGQVRASGSVWTPSSWPCLRYSCVDGTVFSETLECSPPPAGCKAVPPAADQCCPEFHCPPPPEDCTYGGITYRSGERFPDDPVHPCQERRCDDGLVVALSPATVCPAVFCPEPDWPAGTCCRTCPEEPLPPGLEELRQLVLRMAQRLNLSLGQMTRLEVSLSRLVNQLAALMRGSGSTSTVQKMATNVIEMLDILNPSGTGIDVLFSNNTEFLLAQLRLRMTSLVDLPELSLNDDQINNAAIDIHEFIKWLRAFDVTNSANAAGVLMNDLNTFFSGLLQETGCVDAAGVVHAVNSLYLDNPAAPQLCYVCANTSVGLTPLLVMNVSDCGGPPPAGCSAHFTPNSCCPTIQCRAGEAACRDERGELHQHGTTYVDDPLRPCTTYNCTNGVITIVDQISCMPLPAGCTPWHSKGVCCPKSDCPETSCTYDGRERDHGTSWPHEPMRPCLILTCLGGQVTSEDLSPFCQPPPAPNCVPRLVSYQCCPEYDCVTVNCTYFGRVYLEGETWPDDRQYPCRRYRCTRHGTEKIEDVTDRCTAQPYSNCTSRRVLNKCCKEWDCPKCTYRGQTFLEGDVFWDSPQRRCAQSACRFGRVVQLTPPTVCPPVPDGCTPNYVGTSCCHVKYTCPLCMFDPQGTFIQTVDAGDQSAALTLPVTGHLSRMTTATDQSASPSYPSSSLQSVAPSSPASSLRSAPLTSRDSGTLSRITIRVCTAKNGRRYYQNQRWWETTDRPCVQYECRSGRSMLVQNITCPQLPANCKSRIVFGKCCPEKIECGVPPCRSDSGQTYEEGQLWWESAARPCVQYSCRAGRRVLEQTVTCGALNPRCRNTAVPYGQCCPVQTQCGCLDQESTPARERVSSEQWSSGRDPCVTRRCEEGQVTEQRRQPQTLPCPQPPSSGCRTVPPPAGVCACPTFHCEGSRPCVSDGVPRPHGSRWQIGTCTIGTCHDGVVHRAPVTCSPLPADCEPVYDPATCCPTCRPTSPTPSQTPTSEPTPSQTPTPTAATSTEPPDTPTSTIAPQRPENSCEFNGTIYLNQQNWKNQCGSHVCFNGRVISQYVRCPEPTGIECAPIYQAGSCCVRWSCQAAKYLTFCNTGPEGINTMLCYQPGEQEGLCSVTDRPLIGSCCPVFECLRDCVASDGTAHQHGSQWQKGCTVYSCENGTISSAPEDCPPPVNQQCRRTNPEQCCPLYDCDCVTDGAPRPDGAHWTANCSEHWCRRGAVQSRPLLCPEPPRPDCQSLPLPAGRCCPEYSCSCAAVSCPPAPTQPGCEQSGTTADGCCTLYSCAGDCRDDLGRVHTDGTHWYLGCTRYQCLGGNITNATEPCAPAPRPDCKLFFLSEDDCCPTYDCPPPPCTPGERSFDGCNHCECLPPGTLLCTRKVCQEKQCKYRSVTFDHGTVWPDADNPCLSYSCGYGVILSRLTHCPSSPGPLCTPAPLEAGQCCPEWNCSSGPCPANFTDIVSWEDDCNFCTCTGNGIVCTENICHKQCVFEDQHYDTGEAIEGSGACDDLTCVDGVAIPTLHTCSQSPDFECREFSADFGECCPTWACEKVPGIPFPCTPGQIYQGDEECLYCECVELNPGQNEMLCTKRDCTNSGCVDGQEYHVHGSVWRTGSPCQRRTCISGQVTEIELRCHPPPADTCVPLPDDNRCCPVYYCGEPCDSGATWPSDCNTCYCSGGVPICTTEECDDS